MKMLRTLAAAVAFALFMLPGCVKDHYPIPTTQLRVHAEWEEQESVWMAWPTYDNKHDWPARNAYADIIKGLAMTTNIDLIVPDAGTQSEAATFLLGQGLSEADLNQKVRFHIMDYADIWVRDTGPIFVEKDGGIAAVDFKFDGWGWGLSYIRDQAYQDGILLDEDLDRKIAHEVNVPHISSELILEGGGLEFNGRGTVLVSEDVVFQRNPGWTKSAVEAEFAKLFGTKKVIWLKGYLGNDAHPVINAPFEVNFGSGEQNVYTLLTTNGHTDEFVRFINSNTVLLAEPPSQAEADANPISAQSRKMLLEVKQKLLNSTDQDGNPIQIIDFPEVKPLYVDLDTQDDMFNLMATLDFEKAGKANIDENGSFRGVLAASYLNYLVINNVVLVAKYAGYSPDMAMHDAEAVSKLQQAFPGKTIVAVDVKAINVGGGGIHCITKQMPKIP